MSDCLPACLPVCVSVCLCGCMNVRLCERSPLVESVHVCTQCTRVLLGISCTKRVTRVFKACIIMRSCFSCSPSYLFNKARVRAIYLFKGCLWQYWVRLFIITHFNSFPTCIHLSTRPVMLGPCLQEPQLAGQAVVFTVI